MCEAQCASCANSWFDNGDVHECPKCGGKIINRWSDEANEPTPDYGEPEADYDE
jgi:predicted RNA-binding Zn-ribbon protein involved in translation (DUF1610 family)